MRKPKVSVCVVTYNQEKYIEQCLRSILEQKTNFPFEVIVGDDCSTDLTLNIINDLSKEFDNLLIIKRNNNIGGGGNYLDTHSRAQGEYTCHCDGDDYWLPGKLQIQTDAMEKNINCNISWTRTRLLTTDNVIKDDYNNSDFLNRVFTRSDIIRYMALGVNSSLMYKTEMKINYLPPFDILDWYANIERVGDGTAIYVSNEPLTVYRTFIGVSSSGNKVLDVIFKTMNLILKRYPKYKEDLSLIALLSFYSAVKKNEIRISLKFLIIFFKCLTIKSFNLNKVKTYINEVKFLKIR